MAGTFGTMKTRIAAELDRTDLSTFIASAIISSIEYFSTERFWFNERGISFPTVIGKYEYLLPTTDIGGQPIRIIEIDTLNVTNTNGWRYPLRGKNWAELDAQRFTTSFQSEPVHYALNHDSIMVWPIPDLVYTMDGVVLADINQVTTDSASTVTNAWFTYGEEMIRQRAKGDIYENVIRNPERAGAMLAQASAKMQQLKEATERRSAVGNVTPWF